MSAIQRPLARHLSCLSDALRYRLGYCIGQVVKLFVVLLFLFPFYWMIITSFKPYAETIVFPPTLWPQNFTVKAYVTVFTEMNLLNYIVNSVVVTLGIIVLQTAIMLPAAYAFAKYEFKGKGVMFSLVLVAFMIPSQITFITTYLMMAQINLLNTLWPQILPFGANAFGIFLLRQSFKQVPEELIESARLDGAKESGILLRILLPMCQSTMVTVALFSFVSHWNAYFWPLVMTNNEKLRPLTLAIERLKDLEYGLDWSLIMAGNAVLVVPILILFIFASRKIIASFAYRGVK